MNEDIHQIITTPEGGRAAAHADRRGGECRREHRCPKDRPMQDYRLRDNPNRTDTAAREDGEALFDDLDDKYSEVILDFSEVKSVDFKIQGHVRILNLKLNEFVSVRPCKGELKDISQVLALQGF